MPNRTSKATRRKGTGALDREWMSPTEAMRVLRITLPTVHAMIARHELTSEVFAGRVVLRRADVERARRAKQNGDAA